MTTITKGQIACRVAVLRDLAKFQEGAGANDDAWIASDTADLIEAISAEIAELTSLLSKAIEALEPFAKIEPSSTYAADGSEAEGYTVILTEYNSPDFTGKDLSTARKVLADIKAATTTEKAGQ